MDVLDADELEFNIGVIVFIFVAFSCSPVGDCIQLERHLLHRQNILFEEQSSFLKKASVVLQKCLWHNIDRGSRAHSQDVFEASVVSTSSWQNSVC